MGMKKSIIIYILSFLLGMSLSTVEARMMHPYKVDAAYDLNFEVYEQDYVCSVGALYNISCPAIARFPIQYLSKDIINKKMRSVNNARASVSKKGPYLIDPLTHRMWLTSEESPKEVPSHLLTFYNNSLQFYADKNITHHFWCNGQNLIPETIATISSFNVPVQIHDIGEISDDFISKDIFKKFMNDGFFSFAADLAKQELLVKYGGLYADVGMEQLSDIDWYLRKFDQVMCLRGTWVDTGFTAAKKGSEFFSKSLAMISPIMRSVASSNIKIPDCEVHAYKERRMWQLVAGMQNRTFASTAFFYEGMAYKSHGLNTWSHLVYSVTVDYLSGDNK